MSAEEKIKKQRLDDIAKADRETGSIFSKTPFAYVMFIVFVLLLVIILSI